MLPTIFPDPLVYNFTIPTWITNYDQATNVSSMGRPFENFYGTEND